MADLDELLQQATQEILAASDLKSLDHYRVLYLGKKGQLTDYLKSLGQLPAEERPILGQKVNLAKQRLQELIEQQISLLQKNQISQKLAAESIDITLDIGRASCRERV